jgi:hypothetical protein
MIPIYSSTVKRAARMAEFLKIPVRSRKLVDYEQEMEVDKITYKQRFQITDTTDFEGNNLQVTVETRSIGKTMVVSKKAVLNGVEKMGGQETNLKEDELAIFDQVASALRKYSHIPRNFGRFDQKLKKSI